MGPGPQKDTGHGDLEATKSVGRSEKLVEGKKSPGGGRVLL